MLRLALEGLLAFLVRVFGIGHTARCLLDSALTAVLANVQSRAWAEDQLPQGATAASGPQSR